MSTNMTIEATLNYITLTSIDLIINQFLCSHSLICKPNPPLSEDCLAIGNILNQPLAYVFQ